MGTMIDDDDEHICTNHYDLVSGWKCALET